MKLREINNSFTRRLYFEVVKYNEFVNEVYRDVHKRIGVEWMAVTHGHILLNLYPDREMTMTEITDRIRRKAPTTTVLVKKLKKEGYVSSKMSSDDSRINLVCLTDKGREHCEKMEKFLSDFVEAAERQLTEEEVENTIQVLAKIRKNIRLELYND